MKQILLLVLLLSGFSNFAFAQTSEGENNKKEISVCFPEITEAGRQSNFQLNYLYWVKTDEKGFISWIKPAQKLGQYRSFMNVESVIPCIKKWKLNASNKYIIQIIIGTNKETSFLQISDKKEIIKINL